MIALEIARELGINFLMVMQGIYFIHGKPSFTSSFIIALLNNSRQFRTITYEFSADRSSCRVIATKENGDLVEGPVVSLEIARAEGWLTKPGSKWKTMPDLMLRYRAATFFCRVCAPLFYFLAFIQKMNSKISCRLHQRLLTKKKSLKEPLPQKP